MTLFNLWGVIMFFIFSPVSAYLLSVSLRYSVLGGIFLVFLGSTLRSDMDPIITLYLWFRCLPLWFKSLGHVTAFTHLCSIVNNISGPIAMSAPMTISALWFPPNERTRATSIGQMFNALGVGVSYLLGNTIVSRADAEETGDAEHDIMILLSVYSGVSTLILIAVILYYPSKPPLPPSNTAAEERTALTSGWIDLLKNKYRVIR